MWKQLAHEADKGAAMRQDSDRSGCEVPVCIKQQLTAILRLPSMVQIEDYRQLASATPAELVEMPAVKCARTIECKVCLEVKETEIHLFIDGEAQCFESFSAEFTIVAIVRINPANLVRTNRAVHGAIPALADSCRLIPLCSMVFPCKRTQFVNIRVRHEAWDHAPALENKIIDNGAIAIRNVTSVDTFRGFE